MGLQLRAEAPLEALVFRHPAIAGGSLWTWLAVVAAVLGLWRIRSAAAASRTTESPINPSGHAAPSRGDPGSSDLPQVKAVLQKQQHAPEADAQIPTVITVERGCSVGFARKGAVFELRSCLAAEEDDVDGGVEEDVTEAVKEEEEECPWNELDRGSAGGFVDEGSSWKGDLGWYQYQDMAALDGRVVRLWEDEKRVAASPLRRRRPLQAAW